MMLSGYPIRENRVTLGQGCGCDKDEVVSGSNIHRFAGHSSGLHYRTTGIIRDAHFIS